MGRWAYCAVSAVAFFRKLLWLWLGSLLPVSVGLAGHSSFQGLLSSHFKQGHGMPCSWDIPCPLRQWIWGCLAEFQVFQGLLSNLAFSLLPTLYVLADLPFCLHCTEKPQFLTARKPQPHLFQLFHLHGQ